MDDLKNVSRRQILKNSLLASGGALSLVLGSKASAAVCGGTPSQTEGPFYPQTEPDRDNDLTKNKKTGAEAKGRTLLVQGVVVDASCVPVANALVEIWQANAAGRYNHAGDSENPAPLDPNFQYWGRMVTNVKGEYWFVTKIPGDYPASPTWTRTPHIHFKAFRRGFRDLTTQLYFSGAKLGKTDSEDVLLREKLDRLNAKDLILQSLPGEEQAKVISNLEYASDPFGKGALVAKFDISLRAV